MEIDKIAEQLRDRFFAPRKKYHKRRVVFWNDPNGEFKDMISELSLENVKVLVLTGDNNFYAKYLLHTLDPESDYLVYVPFRYNKPEDNWLRDIELMEESFCADLHTMRMNQFHMEESVPIRRAMKLYSKFFESKERSAKFEAMGGSFDTAQQIHLNVLAVLTRAKSNQPNDIIRAILTDSLYVEENQAITAIRKFGSEEVLWDFITKLTGFTPSEEVSLFELAAHILVTSLSGIVESKKISSLARFISLEKQSACYGIIDDWQSSDERESLYELSLLLDETYHIGQALETVDIEILIKADALPCIDESIIRHYMNEISENVIKTTEIIDAVEKRRASSWYGRYSYFYDGIYYTAKIQEFCTQHDEGFHYGEYTDLWKFYCDALYLCDTYYRKFHAAFQKSLENAVSDLDDLFKNVADLVKLLYRNKFLSPVNCEWNQLTIRMLAEKSDLHDIPQQTDFYRHTVKPLISESRVYVIISDALRFEVAKELTHRLITETNGTASITAMQSVFPTITKFGMAALLPHSKITVDDSINVLCDDMPTASTKQRDAVLKHQCSKNVAVTYQDLLAMKQAERRSLVSGAECVYIYHNKIDAIGDDGVTVKQVFTACEEAIEELKNLVRLIVNSMGGSNIIITSDHGFLYSYHPFESYDKVDLLEKENNVVSLSKRYMLTEKEYDADNLIKISMDRFSDSMVGFTPHDCACFKPIGGAINYVHGGISLQECVVPVVSFKNIRANSKNFVELRKVIIQLLGTSRKVSNNIFSLDFYQTEPVKNKVTAGRYLVYFADENDNDVSDRHTVIADKTDENNTNRTYRVRFTMKPIQFDKNKLYYLVIADENTGAIVSKTEYTINIAFTSDFDF